MKKSIILILNLILLTNLYSKDIKDNYVKLNLVGGDGSKTFNILNNTKNGVTDNLIQVEVTPYTIKAGIDFGLGEPVFSGLEKKREELLDRLFKKILEDLKEEKKRNIKNGNYSDALYDTSNNDWVKAVQRFFGDEDIFQLEGCDIGGTGVTNPDSQCDLFEKTELKASCDDDSNNEENDKAKCAITNPFNKFRKEVKKYHEKYVKDIRHSTSVNTKSANDYFDKHVYADLKKKKLHGIDTKLLTGQTPLIDYKKIEEDLIYGFANTFLYAESWGNKETEILDRIVNLTTTENSVKFMMDFAQRNVKNGEELFDFEKVELNFNYANNKNSGRNNNVCKMVSDLFGSDEEARKKANKELNEKIDKMRKQLEKYVMLRSVEYLIEQIGIITQIEFFKRSAQCAIEATVASSSAILGDYGFVDSEALTAIEEAQSALFNADANGNTVQNESQVSTTGSSKTDTNIKETIAECLHLVNKDKDKQVTINSNGELLLELGVPPPNTYSAITEVTQTVTYVPYIAPGAGTGVQTNSLSVKPQVKAKYAECIQKGRSSTWRLSYNNCMDNNTKLEYITGVDLNTEIGKFFDSIRQQKKEKCKLAGDIIESPKYNGKWMLAIDKDTYGLGIGTGTVIGEVKKMNLTWGYLLPLHEKLLLLNATEFKEKSQDIVLLEKELREFKEGKVSTANRFDNLEQLVSCGGTTNAYKCPRSDADMGLRYFCNSVSKDLLKSDILEKIKKSNVDDKQTKISNLDENIKLQLGDIYNCTNIIKNIMLMPIREKNPEQVKNSELNSDIRNIIKNKMLLEKGFISLKDYQTKLSYQNDFKEIWEDFSEKDKENICIFSKRKENIVNTSILYIKCKEYKKDKFKQIFNKALLDFKDFSNFSIKSKKDTLNDVINEKLNLDKYFK
jgi:hypothetical protein